MTAYFECFICGDQSETRTCDRCRNRLRGALSVLPMLYEALFVCRQRLQGGGDGRSSKRLHAPTPGDERVLNLLGPASRQAVTDAKDQIGDVPFLAVLETWSQAVSEERALDHAKKNVTAMTARLTAHLGWICEQPWVVDFNEEIRTLVRTVEGITMTRPRKILLKGVRCPSCDGLTMFRYHPGDWAAECALCPAVKLDERDYDALVMSQVAGLQGVKS